MDDQILALVTAADPVPDASVLLADEADLDAVRRRVKERSIIVHPTIEDHRRPITSAAEGSTARARRPGRLAMALAGVAAVTALIAFVATRTDSESGTDVSDAPADSEPVEAFGSEALAAAEAYMAAFDAGDVDTAVSLLDPSQVNEVADRRMLEFNAAFGAAGFPTTTDGCEVVLSNESLASVECTLLVSDPVIVALGGETLVQPFLYSPSGLVWRDWQGVNVSAIGRAYRTYLSDTVPAEFERVCDPAAHADGQLIVNSGLALTAECGELAAAHTVDVADWIRSGQSGS